MKSYPALSLLLQGYLNLDWPDEYEDPWRAVDDFVASEPVATDVPSEVKDILAWGPSDADLRQLLVEQLGSGYLPDADGWTIADWLAAVADRVRGGSRDS